MPGFDGRGPVWGGGSGAGWGRGPCGAGLGRRRGWGRGFGRGWGQFGWGPDYSFQPPAPKEEKAILNEDLQALREEMKNIENRIKELGAKK